MSEHNQHMGHFVYNALRQHPDSIFKIDAYTGESESRGSVLRRSVQLARCLRRRGLVPGDVLALAGRNHLDVFIPHYAAVMNGLPVVGIDPILKYEEVKSIFKLTEPKIAFCEPESYSIYVKSAADLGLRTTVITFGDGEHSMRRLLQDNPDGTPVDEFEVATIDIEKVYMWLISTGGTSGSLKLAAFRHDVCKQKLRDMITSFSAGIPRGQLPTPADELSPWVTFSASSVHWISGLYYAIYIITAKLETKVQTSGPDSVEHYIDVINKYRPQSSVLPPNLVSYILKNKKHCDLTCFKSLVLVGGKVSEELRISIKERMSPDSIVMNLYGQTENLGLVFLANPAGPPGNCGRPIDTVALKLVDPDTGKEVTEPHVLGELWTKGSCFSCYYNNPEETANTFSPDGWFKTGDLLYRDENDNYFFVERMKMLIKYMGYQIYPLELEEVIRCHEGVLDVAVTSVPHDADEEHVVACVVRQPGSTVSAQEIKDFVANKLSSHKHLHGGVVFLDAIPMTPSKKVARATLKQLVLNMTRE